MVNSGEEEECSNDFVRAKALRQKSGWLWGSPGKPLCLGDGKKKRVTQDVVGEIGEVNIM